MQQPKPTPADPVTPLLQAQTNAQNKSNSCPGGSDPASDSDSYSNSDSSITLCPTSPSRPSLLQRIAACLSRNRSSATLLTYTSTNASPHTSQTDLYNRASDLEAGLGTIQGDSGYHSLPPYEPPPEPRILRWFRSVAFELCCPLVLFSIVGSMATLFTMVLMTLLQMLDSRARLTG
jgi:hypothetical protein